MSQYPTVSQPNATSSSNDGQAVNTTRPPPAPLETTGRVSSARHIATRRFHHEPLPSVRSIQTRASQSPVANTQLHSILNPSDTSQQRPSPRNPQPAFLQLSVTRGLSPETTGGYREEPQPPNFSRLSSALSSPRSLRNPLPGSRDQDQRGVLTQWHDQQALGVTQTSSSNPNRWTSASNTTHLPRYGPTHQTAQTPYSVRPLYSSLSVASSTAQVSGYHDSQISSRGHIPGSDASSGQTSPGPIHGALNTLPSQEQRSYHMMTLDTEQGQIPIRVDVEAASRVADEKRRRNASASARFRARRKEKEHANSQEIEDLKREIHELSEDAAFYRQERDYLAALVLRTPQGDRHFPRPLSPRQRRAQSQREELPISSPAIITQRYDTYQEQGRRGSESRHTRRRVSTEAQYITPPIAPAAAAYPPQPSYNQQVFGQSLQSGVTPSSQPPSLQNYFPHEPPQIQQSYPARSAPYIYPTKGAARSP